MLHACMTAPDHPLRATLSQEMHVRRFPRFAAPARLMQLVMLLGDNDAEPARAHLAGLIAEADLIVPPSPKYAVLGFGERTLIWERHTEFATYTLLRPGPFADPFDAAIFNPLLDRVQNGLPGQAIRGSQIALAPEGPGFAPEDLSRWFADEAIILCDAAGGTARIASDFRLNSDGYGRLMVFDRGLERDEPAQLVLRVQELGNYRKLALLGLPLAQQHTPAVTALERRLAVLTHAISERTSEDDVLLDELTFLSAELARILSETRYRMSATRAYAQLSTDRLASLEIGTVRGYQTLADFTERRLVPAVRTCDSFTSRLEDLSQRAAWSSALLRTRVDIALATQNRDLLHSMDQRTHLQLRLQETVEGLSIVAISYYAVALLGYLLHLLPVEQEIAKAVSVVVVVAIVALGLRRLRKRLAE